MAKYPQGNFTVINNETGRALRVRLGISKEIRDHKEGTDYLQHVTEKPTLQLGEADNSPATVWWHSTIEDSQQIVSYAVGEYQNIGDYCVWMHAETSSTDLFNAIEAFQNRLDDMPTDVRSRLAPLIPAEWAAVQARNRAADAESDWLRELEEARAYADAEQEAWTGQDDPPSTEDLAALRSYRYAVASETAPRLETINDVMRALGISDAAKLIRVLKTARPNSPIEMHQKVLALLTPQERKAAININWAAVKRLDGDPRLPKVKARAQELLPAVKERRAAAALAAIPEDDLSQWHHNCAVRKVRGEQALFRFTNRNYDTSEDKRIVAALDAYLKAAADEGVTAPVIASNATTRMDGCGGSRSGSSTYGWIYDGTYIYGSDSETVPAERTYWTDEGGYLVGKPKGGPGQTWSIKPWTPSKSAGTSRSDIALTGLFGPISRALGL
ncbi:hypothetical protein ACWDZX_08070 [Streptomyces collinus]